MSTSCERIEPNRAGRPRSMGGGRDRHERPPGGRRGTDPRAPAAPHRRDRGAARRRPLSEIGQVLRHRAALTTAIYPRSTATRCARWRPVAGSRVVSGLERSLADSVAVRRPLGYKLERAGKLLAQFITFLDAVGAHDRARAHVGDAARRWQAPLVGLASALRRRRGRRVPERIDPLIEHRAIDLAPQRVSEGTRTADRLDQKPGR